MSAHVNGFATIREVLEENGYPKQKRRPAKAGRLTVVYGALTAAILVLFGAELWYAYTYLDWASAFGNDLHIYTDATARLFSGGSWFLDRQLHGPYPLVNGDVLYPPVAAFAFAPWLVLPYWLYLLIPVVGIAWLVYGWKPAPWAWPLMALCLLYPGTGLKFNAGNPSIYVALFTGLGLRYGWPAALIFLKPSMFPLALIGVRHRLWLPVVALLFAGSYLFLNETREWPSVVYGAEGAGFLYSLSDLPMALIPVIAWLAQPGVNQRFQHPDDVLRRMIPLRLRQRG